MGVECQDARALPDPAQDVPQGIDLHFVEADGLHLLPHPLHHGFFLATGAGDGDDVLQEGDQCFLLRLGLAEERRRSQKPPSYTIEKGDCLWVIAGMEKVYGDPMLWPLLYEANSSQIDNPDLIYPNDQLSIPRDIPAGDMEAQARRFYRTYARD